MSQKYVVVHFVKLAKVPDEFPYTKWPLHITLLANFTIAKPLEDLHIALREYSRQLKPFSIVVDGEAIFGRNQDVAVSLIQPNKDIMNVHAALADIASSLGATFDEPAFMGDGYRPHATMQVNARILEKQTVALNDFTLVDMYPDGDIYKRRNIETYKLCGVPVPIRVSGRIILNSETSGNSAFKDSN